jgi:hypothetical protein
MRRLAFSLLPCILLFLTVGATIAKGADSAQQHRPVPSLEISEPALNYFPDRQEIEGTAEVTNQEGVNVTNLLFTADLLRITPETPSGFELIHSTLLPERYHLAPRENRLFRFVIRTDPTLPKGGYFVALRAYTNQAYPLTWKFASLDLEGTGEYLRVVSPDSVVLQGEQASPPLSGVKIDPSGPLSTRVTLENLSEKTLSAYPEISVYRDGLIPGNEPVDRSAEKPVSLPPRTKQVVTVPFPPVAEPGTYLAHLRFFTPDGQPLSNTEEYRFIVNGPGGKILAVNFSGTRYLTRLAINGLASVVGPADGTEIAGTSVRMEVRQDSLEGPIIGNTSIPVETLSSIPLELAYPFIATGWHLRNPTVYARVDLIGPDGKIYASSAATVLLQLQNRAPVALVIALLFIILGTVGYLVYRQRLLKFTKR